MQTSVTFKNLDPSETLKDYVREKLNRFDKLLDNPSEANVVLSVEKFRHIAEININGDRLNINGKEETVDMYSAIDMVLDKIEKQIKRNKQKIKQHRTGSKERARQKERQYDEVAAVDDGNTDPVSFEFIEYKPMDVDEAVMQMDLISDNFLVFLNARTDRVNVLYRKKDGGFGLIQPK